MFRAACPARTCQVSILFRYFAKEIFFATLLLLFALLALFALFDLIGELGSLGGGYQLLSIVTYVALQQPAHAVVIFPVAALMGTLFAVTRLSSQSELTVMRASGLSLRRLAGFAVGIGLLFSLMTFLFGEFVAPAADDLAKRVKMSATSAVVARQFRSGFWVKDDLAFINIQSVTPDTSLVNMRVYEFDKKYQLVSLSVAEKARFDKPANRWVMQQVQKTTFEGNRVRMEKLPVAYWNSAMTPELLSVLLVRPEEMSLFSLSAYIDHLRENKQTSTQYELAFWNKLLQPIAVVIMMLIAIPFGIQSNRAGGVGAKLLLGIMIGLVFYFLNQMVSHLTLLNNWSTLLSSTLPLMVFLGVALILLVRKEYAVRRSPTLRWLD
jgi:lipopolysaccharide export system permease protein